MLTSDFETDAAFVYVIFFCKGIIDFSLLLKGIKSAISLPILWKILEKKEGKNHTLLKKKENKTVPGISLVGLSYGFTGLIMNQISLKIVCPLLIPLLS